MKYCLTEKELAAIEKALNRGGAAEVTVRIENSKVIVLAVEKKKLV